MKEVGETPMRITLNGEPHEVALGDTIASILHSLGQHPRTVAVEYNGEIVRRDSYSTTPIAHGDRLEVVRFVQGGAGSAPALRLP
jgi:thiamine biosynthesis protein ThiS